MLEKKQILKLLHTLSDKLARAGEVGEICLVGGAVMCLVYNCRNSTKDVDAIFEPATIIRKLAREIADENGIAEDWLNDAAKEYLQPNLDRQEVLALPNLRIWAPDARYMLAMKCISARWDTNDKDDVIFLITHLAIKEAKMVFELIEGYYPKQLIPAKTQFFVEELLEDLDRPA